MWHALFIVLHVIAFLFFAVALFITVPLHALYAVMANRSRGPTAATHAACPTCRELVHKEASLCRYCGQTLVPESVEIADRAAARAAELAGKPWYIRILS